MGFLQEYCSKKDLVKSRVDKVVGGVFHGRSVETMSKFLGVPEPEVLDCARHVFNQHPHVSGEILKEIAERRSDQSWEEVFND